MIGELKQKFAKNLHVFLSEMGVEELQNMIEITPENISGDLAFPCFTLAKSLKKSPNMIAEDLATKLGSDFEAVGGYVNEHVNAEFVASKIIPEILEKGETFGAGEKKSEIILVESPGPNTNKPLHLGHVRNLLLGNALENVLNFAGFDAKRVDIVNDRGVHICKSMLAYKDFGNNAEPNKKSDHFVGDRYVKYATEVKNNPKMETEIQEMLKAREDKDIETRNLRKKMNKRALDGHKVTYTRYGTTIEKAYLESDHYEKGKDIVEEFLSKGIFEKLENGNIVCDLENLKLDKKVVLRADGTSIYITQDIALAQLRYEDYKMDRMIHVVANEQRDHFRALFEILKRLNFTFADKAYHLSYGMISLPNGKMKSREGNVIDADNLADEMHEEAKILLAERYPDLSEDELNIRAEAIAMSAIKFFILKYEVAKDFVFDPKESLSFEGETGPYLQYTFARANSILEKSGKPSNSIFQGNLLKESEERSLLMKLAEFEEMLLKSAIEYKPNFVARWCLDLAKLFNNYYHKHKILGEDKALQNARLLLIKAVSIGLQNGLNLLGIDTLDEM